MSNAKSDNGQETVVRFDSFGLDARILKALKKLSWVEATSIQASALPLALSGKDLLVQATTGSGKTAIFLLPMLQKLLVHKESSSKKSAVFGLVLTPTKELCNQAKECCVMMSRYLKQCVSCAALNPAEVKSGVFSSLDLQTPDILIATPHQILQCLKSHSNTFVRKIRFLAIDEADAMFSYGFEKQIRELMSFMPRSFQSVVVSATLCKEIGIIKTLIPHNLAVVRLRNQELPDKRQLKQWKVSVTDWMDRYAILLYLFKFELIRGKCLLFCNTSKNAYKLKLFLDSFKLDSCVLDDQLPFNSRQNALEQFNGNKYNIVVATDLATQPFKNDKCKQRDGEYSLSRGVDFQNVSVVVNFDFPAESSVYIHRAGRTARGVRKGTVLSFVHQSQVQVLNEIQARVKSEDDTDGEPIEDYCIDRAEVNKLVYRVNDVLSSISRRVVNSAQMQQIHREVLQSEKLQSYFKRHPNDLVAIEHQKNSTALSLKRKFDQVANIPEYLAPPSEASLVPVNEQTEQSLAIDEKNKKKQLHKETLEYYKKLGLLKKGSKKQKKDPLKAL